MKHGTKNLKLSILEKKYIGIAFSFSNSILINRKEYQKRLKKQVIPESSLQRNLLGPINSIFTNQIQPENASKPKVKNEEDQKELNQNHSTNNLSTSFSSTNSRTKTNTSKCYKQS